MAIVHYPAIIEKGDDGYGVFFPDLPGCVSFGNTQSEAFINAEEALALHIEGMIEDGLEFPIATRLDDLDCDIEVNEVARILVRCETSEAKMRINVMLPTSLVAAIDAKSSNRSEFITNSVRKVLAG